MELRNNFNLVQQNVPASGSTITTSNIKGRIDYIFVLLLFLKIVAFYRLMCNNMGVEGMKQLEFTKELKLNKGKFYFLDVKHGRHS
nr:MAG TPA: hypothetical protein [Caudoviricetes sp.]